MRDLVVRQWAPGKTLLLGAIGVDGAPIDALPESMDDIALFIDETGMSCNYDWCLDWCVICYPPP